MLRICSLQTRMVQVDNLEVPAGDITALTGASGSGKSVLLRAIADLDPAEGHVTLEDVGRDTMTAPEWRRRVCYVGPEAGWWTDQVGDHFDPDSRKNASALAVRCGLDPGCLAWSVARLSTGERQRLGLVRAMSQSPNVLLLDEPTGALDGETTTLVEAELKRFVTAGGAILMVSHDEAQVTRLTTRVYRIEGRALMKKTRTRAPSHG